MGNFETVKDLRQLKNQLDSDDIRWKEVIKRKLLNNEMLIHALNNKDLEEADDYFGVNILPYYIIHPTQTNVGNFVCFETQFDDIERGNKIFKYGQVVFYILCEQKNLIDEETYIARHDLLAALIIDEFNWTNYFGLQCHCVSNKPSVTDNDYACRTLIFELETPNNIIKTQKSLGRPTNVNYEVFT